MPSWNIHIAEAEGLLAAPGAEALGVRDPNVFLFGNLVPDVYVGYMVPDVSHKRPYRETHFAGPGAIPCPRDDEFWDRYIVAADRRGEDPGDLVLGVWAHLAADNIWNSRVRRFIAARGIPTGERTRVRKQADFDVFGKTLSISLAPTLTDDLVRAAQAFPQYAIEPQDTERAVTAAQAIVAHNEPDSPGEPVYDLLDQAFFEDTFRAVREHTARRLTERARVLG